MILWLQTEWIHTLPERKCVGGLNLGWAAGTEKETKKTENLLHFFLLIFLITDKKLAKQLIIFLASFDLSQKLNNINIFFIFYFCNFLVSSTYKYNKIK